MSDASLCGAPDRIPCCASCWRNPDHHPDQRDDPWQSWLFPERTGDVCANYIQRDDE